MEFFFPEIFHTPGESNYFNSQVHLDSFFILLDIVNQMWFLLIIFLFYYFKLVRLRLFLFLIVTAFLPFLINGIVFPISYMPDQLQYFISAYNFRNVTSESVYWKESVFWNPMMVTRFEFTRLEFIRPDAIHFISFMFAYFPIPFINSVASLAIINRMIYTVMIILSVHYKIIRGKMILFFLLFPGLILYSSIALREMIILALMLGTAYCLIYKRYFFIIPLLIFLFLLKFQNAIILGTISIFYVMFFGNYYGSKFLKIFFLSSVFFLLILLYFYFQTNLEHLINGLEELRRYFYAEECRKIKGYWCWDGYKPLDFSRIYIFIIPTIFDFAFAPLIWESANVFQYLQSFENIFVNLLFILLLYQLFKYNRIKTIFWLVAICFAYGLYGMLIFNFGTLSRFRFPFIVTFIFIISSEINKFKFNKTQFFQL